MLRLAIPENEQNVIGNDRLHHPHPRVQQRMWAVWLKSKDFSHQDIARALDVCSDTVLGYLKLYEEEGIEGLRAISFNRPESELKVHQETLESHFRKNPPATVAQARADIKRLTGIERSPTQIAVFLRSMGMRCRKTGAVPAKVDVDAQELFKKKI